MPSTLQGITQTSQTKKNILFYTLENQYSSIMNFPGRNKTSLFDVTMRSDWAEIFDLVEVFIISKLTAIYKRNSSIGFYRDEGLAAFEGSGPRTADKIRKNFSAIFNEMGLNIVVQAHMKIVDYLGITWRTANIIRTVSLTTSRSTSIRCPTTLHQSLNSYPMPSTTHCSACLPSDLNLKKQCPSIKTLKISSSSHTEQLASSEPKKQTPRKK